MTTLSGAAGPWMLWAAERLLTGSVQGAIIIGFVALVCWRIAAVPATVRAALWWLASLKLLMAFLPLPVMPLPFLPSQGATLAKIADISSPYAAIREVDVAAVTPPAATQRAGASRPAYATAAGALEVPFWVGVVLTFWLTGIAAHAVQLMLALRRQRGVRSRALPLGEEDVMVATRIADCVGLRRRPEIRVSDEIDSPQVVGVRRPVVLLPTTVVTAFTATDRTMTLCHELVHIRRHDLALGWVPALAERLFFFHPLARFAAREYLVAREAACDAAVLRALGVAPQEYGRLLLRFGVTRPEPGFAATGASPSTSSLRRRLDMLNHITHGPTSRRATWILAAIVALALVPFQLVARTSNERAVTGEAIPEAQVAAASQETVVPNARRQAPLPDLSLLERQQTAVQERLAEVLAQQELNKVPTEAFLRDELRRLQESFERDLPHLPTLEAQEQLKRETLLQSMIEQSRKALEQENAKREEILREFEARKAEQALRQSLLDAPGSDERRALELRKMAEALLERSQREPTPDFLKETLAEAREAAKAQDASFEPRLREVQAILERVGRIDGEAERSAVQLARGTDRSSQSAAGGPRAADACPRGTAGEAGRGSTAAVERG